MPAVLNNTSELFVNSIHCKMFLNLGFRKGSVVTLGVIPVFMRGDNELLRYSKTNW